MKTTLQRRKRYRFNAMRLVKNLMIMGLVIVIIAIFVNLSDTLFSNANKIQRYETYHVVYGDTLWTIAQSYPEHYDDIRTFIYQIKEANQLDSTEIFPGQRLQIPLNGA